VVAKLDQETCRRIYHQALLRYIGCNADTRLLAAHLRLRTPGIRSTWQAGYESQIPKSSVEHWQAIETSKQICRYGAP
jgi:hypothetical protein